MRRTAFDVALNSDTLIGYLCRLAMDAGRKIYLIVDNLRVHHSKPVKACRPGCHGAKPTCVWRDLPMQIPSWANCTCAVDFRHMRRSFSERLA